MILKNQQTIQERWNVCSHRTLVDDRTPGDQSILDVASRRFDLVALLAYYVPTQQAHTAMRAICLDLRKAKTMELSLAGMHSERMSTMLYVLDIYSS